MRSGLSISTGSCALFTYVTYAALPVRLHEAVVAGLALSIVNIGAHLILDEHAEVHVSIHYYLLYCITSCYILIG